jgi:hypothetical protein
VTGTSTIAPLTCALIWATRASMKASSVDSKRRACSHHATVAISATMAAIVMADVA